MITLHNLTYHYGDKPVLDGLNATIESGAFYAVMGANGCGKTTLLRLVGGLLPLQQGDVLIEDRSVQSYRANELARRMAYVRQQSPGDFEFSAFEMVLMGRNPYQRRLQNESAEDWAIVERYMQLTGTWHLRFKRPGEMSGGELQRVMIARALTQETPILLLDEPISNLDIAHQFEIMELLQHINREEGKTILLVIHDLGMALRYCRQLLLLHQGVIHYQGPINEGLTPANIATVFHIRADIHDGNITSLLPLP